MSETGLQGQGLGAWLRQQLFTYDDAYGSCLYRVTGPFSGASLDVMRECDRQARIVANLDDPTAARAELAR